MRNIDKEKEYIRNGNRYVQENSGRGVFARDSDRLFHQYSNLRWSVYNKHKDSFNDETTRAELQSYIDEQFIKLVKEYEINGAVDFPGYIKTKLNQRVKHTFVKNVFRDKARERLGADEFEVANLVDRRHTDEALLEDQMLQEYVFGKTEFTPIQKELLVYLLEKGMVSDERVIIRNVASKFKVSREKVNEELSELRFFVSSKIAKYESEKGY